LGPETAEHLLKLKSGTIAGDLVKAQSSAVLLLCIFAALHAFDDHRMVKLAIRRTRPLIVLLRVLAITISHGSSTKFIYFDF
jgi:alginate O-acetyltransferase complex protein AlgI